jgi:hypothetical protein
VNQIISIAIQETKFFLQSRHLFLPFTMFYMKMKTKKACEMVVLMVNIKSNNVGLGSYDKMNIKISLL